KYHFQFQNGLNLFAEVAHREKYGANIYSGNKASINFYSINNLFHPSTIDSSFYHDSFEECGGIKVKDNNSGEYRWNLSGHKERIIFFDEEKLKILGDDEDWEGVRLISSHTSRAFETFSKIVRYPSKLKDYESR